MTDPETVPKREEGMPRCAVDCCPGHPPPHLPPLRQQGSRNSDMQRLLDVCFAIACAIAIAMGGGGGDVYEAFLEVRWSRCCPHPFFPNPLTQVQCPRVGVVETAPRLSRIMR